MAIEKMTFIDINGNSANLDDVLLRCIKCELFQPENAAKLSEYSIGTTALLRNPYGGIIIKINEIASQLRIELDSTRFVGDFDNFERDTFIENTHARLDKICKEFPKYFDKRNKINDDIMSYTTALEMLGHVDESDIDFDELFQNKYLKIRFGRLPTQNLSKLSVYKNMPYEFYKLDSDQFFTWCLYFTAAEYRDDIDNMFRDMRFERLRIPDYVHGTATSAISYLNASLNSERKLLEQAVTDLEEYISVQKGEMHDIYSKTRFAHDAYDLRKFVVSIDENFHLVGFVLKSDEKAFVSLFDDLPDLNITASPVKDDPRIPAPVRLRNNWFVKPFEMFVNMYGSPSYNDIDPSPFVAYTYSLLFGMMFGDVGQGFVVCILGVILWKYKKMQLGQIMSRIGVVSMFFGVLYGSVFGFEHMLDGFYKNVFGLHEKPIEVMHPDTTNKILIAAIVLGASIILMVIIFNILIGIKRRDFERTVLSHNGVAGLILYSAVLLAVFENMTHTEYLTKSMELVLIVLPLVLVFLREPLAHLLHYLATGEILKEKPLQDVKNFQDGSINFQELFCSQFVTARFGRIPTDSFRKLSFYENKPFMIYPVKSSHNYIWCVYATALTNKKEIDAIFRDLLFERIFIPNESLSSNEAADNYIKRCVAAGGVPDDENGEEAQKYGTVKTEKHVGIMYVMFPEGVGNFLTQTFFEMFEVVLSFVTNTMSFLRVGGFILVHAGMMAVVFTLAEMVGGGASPVVIIIGNIFVMALEGLIVGIQVLRLEFYEIFSRFFDADGGQFKPATVKYSQN